MACVRACVCGAKQHLINSANRKYEQRHSRGRNSFLGVDSQHEISLIQRLKRRRHDAVGTRRQLVSTTYLAHVDERRRLAHRRVVLEVVYVQRSAVGIFQLHNVGILSAAGDW